MFTFKKKTVRDLNVQLTLLWFFNIQKPLFLVKNKKLTGFKYLKYLFREI